MINMAVIQGTPDPKTHFLDHLSSRLSFGVFPNTIMTWSTKFDVKNDCKE